MLTPVRAASNTSLSSHSQSAALASSALGRSVVAPAPVQAVEAADLNSSIAGKLNILLAAARERMFEALLDAINAASDALPLPRQDGESNLAFASRLAEAIQKLPASRINEIETQLASQGHNLPLPLIAEALKNPAGPEAARVVTYLETLRYKDRDLAARAVMRSYRQNDASPLRAETRPDILLQEESLLPVVKERQTTTASAPQAPAPAPAKQDESPVTKTAATIVGQVQPAKQPVDTASEESPVVAGSAVEFSDLDMPAEEPAPTLEPPPLEAAEVIQTHAPVVSKHDAEPDIPKVWTAVLASISEEAAELIVTIIGEQETAALLEDLAIEPHAVEAIIDEVAAGDIPAEKLAAVADMQVKPQQAETARLPVADAAQLIRQQKEIVAQPHLLPADIAEAVQKSGLFRPAEGLGYAQHPYQFAKDGAERRDGEMHRRDYEGNEPEGDEQAQSDTEQRNAGDQQGDQRPKGRVPEDLPEIEPSAPRNSVGDPVFALYQRMVGWE